ncbi:uncharacterized protein HMPREF1541_06736 [Cyphellophora europaea CBS 101466]|uniref:HCNGP-like protein n=1 Tax=Cyphellophora europaea (strain CBS 101466) TaxID=1220924 RepID=W2RSJ5_CYPE1|nr:uncharacterized protein HMPREF1541_06736 [Cyphellophora europaea CBS 101466]ETN38699.1 hypothetical protein HMPREF1541_06736 [Cyphellophora europaea CBS 101466]
MSGLVAYDSSDEEVEQASAPSVPVPTLASAPRETASAPNGATNFTTSANAIPSLVGPVMPTEEYPEIEDLNDLPESMSEQDLVRHLTQASHPMTAIPLSPPGSPNAAVEAKFKRFLELKSKGLHFNEDLANKSSFRNPALFSTLMERTGLDGSSQYTTSLPKSVYEPQSFPSYAYKEELARSQQSIRDQQAARKKQASAAGKRTIEFIQAGGSGTSSQKSTPGSQRRGLGS